MSSQDPIIVELLTKRFGTFTAVDELDMRVERGTVHGFLGPNGSGKTTTLRLLVGLYRPTSGTIRVLGMNPETDPANVSAHVSFVPGDVNYWPNFTGRQVLDTLAALRRRTKSGGYNHQYESELIDRFAFDPTKKVKTYSTGNRQKIALISAFAAETPVLLLDEPTAGLDPLMERHFQQCLREATSASRTILLSSHILSEVERTCSAVSIIRNGKLVESGTIRTLRKLASTTITARIKPDGSETALQALEAAGGSFDIDPHDINMDAEPDSVLIRGLVNREKVGTVLKTLVDLGATDISSNPASLEQLFIRHYEVDAR